METHLNEFIDEIEVNHPMKALNLSTRNRMLDEMLHTQMNFLSPFSCPDSEYTNLDETLDDTINILRHFHVIATLQSPQHLESSLMTQLDYWHPDIFQRQDRLPNANSNKKNNHTVWNKSMISNETRNRVQTLLAKDYQLYHKAIEFERERLEVYGKLIKQRNP